MGNMYFNQVVIPFDVAEVRRRERLRWLVETPEQLIRPSYGKSEWRPQERALLVDTSCDGGYNDVAVSVGKVGGQWAMVFQWSAYKRPVDIQAWLVALQWVTRGRIPLHSMVSYIEGGERPYRICLEGGFYWTPPIKWVDARGFKSSTIYHPANEAELSLA